MPCTRSSTRPLTNGAGAEPVPRRFGYCGEMTESAADVVVRLAQARDLPGLAALRWHWSSEQHGAEKLPPLDQYVSRALEWAHDHSETHIPYAAVSEAETVGMAWLAIMPRVPAPLSEDRSSGDVQSCFVVPRLRGIGIGHRLISAVLADARQRGLEYVTVHSSKAAVTMYERAGFKHYSQLLGTNPGGVRI